MDTGTKHDEMCASPKHATTQLANNERFKYSLDNPVTLKSLSNIRTILDQHANFLMGLAATSSNSLKTDLTPLSVIPTLFILQRLFIPLRIHQPLPDPIFKGRLVAKPEIKEEFIQNLNVQDTEVIAEPKGEEIIKGSNDCHPIPANSLTNPPPMEVVEQAPPIDRRHTTEVKKEDVVKGYAAQTLLGASMTKQTSRKNVAFYAEVDQEVEEIRKRLLAASPQPWATSLVNGNSTDTTTGGKKKFELIATNQHL